jgi:hypothetical protein
MPTLKLPTPDGGLIDHRMQHDAQSFTRPQQPLRSRRPFAAAHVVADPFADNTPGRPATIDWEATLAFRHHLWSWGLPVAEAMDTAQRGMGLDWANIQTLVRSSCAEAQRVGGGIACGANTDQLDASSRPTLDQIVDAYLEQVALVEGAGGQAVVMASRHLAVAARGPDDYHEVYRQVLGQTSRPAIVHWLGPMFDPALEGYWGSPDLDEATQHFLALLGDNRDRIDGVKISLLAKEREIDMRRRLPEGVRMYSGDDFAYPETIGGDDEGHSDAFLGAFDLVAPAASAAIQALDAGRPEECRELLDQTLPLAQHVFSPPTYYYKCGVVFMAYLNGHQDHFRMVHGLESTRSVLHLTRQFQLADEAGLFEDPDSAAERMRRYLALAGIA